MATWQSPAGYEPRPELLHSFQEPELVDFLREDVPLNLFQLAWVERHGVEAIHPNAFHFRVVRDARGALRSAALVITNRLMVLDARDQDDAASLGDFYRDRCTHLHHIVAARSAATAFWQHYSRPDSHSDFSARLIQDQEMYYLTPEMVEEVEPSFYARWPREHCLRRAHSGDLDALFLASARMHHEETLEDPLERDADSFRRHVRYRIEAGRSFVWFDDHHRLVFKADLSAVSAYGVQLSGVYTNPLLRGRGFATRAMAALCRLLVDEGAPLVTLYVNEFNAGAKRVYTRVGFRYYAPYQTVFVNV